MDDLVTRLRNLGEFVDAITVTATEDDTTEQLEESKARLAAWAADARHAAELLERSVMIPVDCGREDCGICAAEFRRPVHDIPEAN